MVGSRLLNIGRGGLMLEAPIALAPESTLHLRLLLGGQRADVDARVCACVERGTGRRRSWGVGLQFESLPPEAAARLDRALRPARTGRA